MAETKLFWFALKVFFNKVFEWEERLTQEGFETYLAVEKRCLKGEDHLRAARKIALEAGDAAAASRYIREGVQIYERRPLIASLLFVKASRQDALGIDKELAGKGFIYKKADKKTLSAIPEKQMASFRLVTSSLETGLTFFSDDSITRYRQGARVRVKEGPLKGAEGYIKRIRKDRRLLVSIEGVVAVATSYIPPQMLEIVPELS